MESIDLKRSTHSSQSANPTSNSSQHSFQRLHSLDLLNIEYDDILHLYRGFRKTEGLLSDKSKEYESLAKQYETLQQNFNNCQDKLKSLETLRDNTHQLETQILQLHQQNEQLVHENNELAQISIQAEEIVREKISLEEQYVKEIGEMKETIAVLQNKYDELCKSKYVVDQSLQDILQDKEAMTHQMHEVEDLNEVLKEENFILRKKLDAARDKLTACDRDLTLASEKLLELSTEVASMAQTEASTQLNSTENFLLKRDISRLLKLLENYPNAHGFLSHWRDSGGMSYVGPLSMAELRATAAHDQRATLQSIQSNHPGPKHDFPVPHTLEVGFNELHGVSILTVLFL